MERLEINLSGDYNFTVLVGYEPVLDADDFYNFRVIKNFDEFKNIPDVIVVNRLPDEIRDVEDKVYTRDLFSRG